MCKNGYIVYDSYNLIRFEVKFPQPYTKIETKDKVASPKKTDTVKDKGPSKSQVSDPISNKAKVSIPAAN